MSNASPVQQVWALLSWQDERRVARSIHSRYLAQLEGAVDFWLALTPHDGAVRKRRLARQFARLPQPSRIRLLTAPETYRRLVYRLADSSLSATEFFEDSLCAEHCLVGKTPHLAKPVWSARGDAYFPASNDESVRRKRAAGKDWAWRAPTIMHGPAIDGLSPFCTMEADDGSAIGTAHSPPELALVAERLRDAVQRIGTVSTSALETILLFTKVIVCRKSIAPQVRFLSTSWPASIGKTAVLNLHLRELTRERIANALIHEAIHAGLFMAEVCEPSVIHSPRISRATAVSPWSGHTLPVYNYIHACFVWYGLWGFWRLAMQSQRFTPAAMLELMSRASSGFRGPSLLAPLKPLRRYIAPTVLDSIRQSQETVLGFHSPS